MTEKSAKPKMLAVDGERYKRLEAEARKRRRATGDPVTWGTVAREAIDEYLS